MRIAVIKDKDVPQKEFEECQREVIDIYKSNADIDVYWDVFNWSIPDLPFDTYYVSDGEAKKGIAKKYLRTVTKMLESTYGKRFDHVLFSVADHNFRPVVDAGIWGWNISSAMRGYNVHQCRFDTVSSRKDSRIANSLGTVYHEIMHSHDTFAYRMIGGDVTKMSALGISDWDAEAVHGENENYDYIRHKENQDALKAIAPLLKIAYEKRRKQFNEGASIKDRVVEGYRNEVVKRTQPFAVPYYPH